MTNFRPTTLSPEALKVWDEAEANIQASLQRIRELTAPVRKPAEPGLKAQALVELEEIMTELHESTGSAFVAPAIRRALEALPND